MLPPPHMQTFPKSAMHWSTEHSFPDFPWIPKGKLQLHSQKELEKCTPLTYTQMQNNTTAASSQGFHSTV